MFSPLSVFFAIFIIGSCQSLFARRYLLIKFMAFSLGPNHSTASYWRGNNHVGKNASLLAIIILKDSEYGRQTWKSHVSMIAWSNSYLKVSTCSFISRLLFLNFSFLKVRPVYSKSPSKFGNLIYLLDWFFDVNHFAHFALNHRIF